MKTHLRGVALVLPFILTACEHKSHQIASQPLAPPIVDTPPANPAPPPAELPPPVVTVPGQSTAPQTTTQAQPPEETPKPKVHHKKPAAKDPEQASNPTPEVSAIGQLSPGDPTDLQQQTVSSITSTERGLSEITRKLSDQEQKTAAQIREFIKQAKAALASSDVDGAHTLAVKAKVLLAEISE
jgi:hypothetical protein